MRTIKFRGKCIQTGEFVEGDLIHGVGAKSGKMYILPLVKNLAHIKYCDPLDGVEVIPKTIGEFTGLLDKNGNEIYEGDVVLCKFGYCGNPKMFSNEEMVIVKWGGSVI